MSARSATWLVCTKDPVHARWDMGASFRHDEFAELVSVAGDPDVPLGEFSARLRAFQERADLPRFVYDHGSRHNVSFAGKAGRDFGLRRVLAILKNSPFFGASASTGRDHGALAAQKVGAERYDERADDRCPLCNSRDCEKHALACFDVTFANVGHGAFGMGCIGGTISKVEEIEDLFAALRRAWVRSVRLHGAAEAPQWVAMDAALAGYFARLNEVEGFNAASFETQDQAEEELRLRSYFLAGHARNMLAQMFYPDEWCGLTTSWMVEVPMFSTQYTAWWDPNANERLPDLQRVIRAKMAS